MASRRKTDARSKGSSTSTDTGTRAKSLKDNSTKPFVRKHLTVPEEEFYAAVLATFGEPVSPSPSQYMAPSYYNAGRWWDRGLGAWLKYDQKGQQWLILIDTYGEAKSRAGKLYMAYCRWYNKGRKHGIRDGSEQSRGD
jgi:hypothetical protein